MALFPFSIADIDEPEHIRVVLYASGRMGHAPLNALLKKNCQDIESLDEKQSRDITQLTKRMDAVEQQLKTLMKVPNDIQQNTQQSTKDSKTEGESSKVSGGDLPISAAAR